MLSCCDCFVLAWFGRDLCWVDAYVCVVLLAFVVLFACVVCVVGVDAIIACVCVMLLLI